MVGVQMQNYSLIKIVVAESHKLIKEGLIILLNSFQNFMVIDEAEDGYELITKCKRNPPDVALVDFDLTEPDTISSIHSIKSVNKNIRFILMTSTENELNNRNEIKRISNGIISKKISPNELAIAIQNVMIGDFFLYHNSLKNEEPKYTEVQCELDGLTKRENEILYYLAKGMPSKEIADKLFLSTRTVDSHRSKIIQKYNLHTASELVHFAHEAVKSNGNGNGNGKK
jgi:DNA-binding NarL/FixJ family response regulator